jgi:hypothetical protein
VLVSTCETKNTHGKLSSTGSLPQQQSTQRRDFSSAEGATSDLLYGEFEQSAQQF